jgi:hypothetical protein
VAAAVPAVSLFLQVIDTMPGAPREEAIGALLDWWGTFRPEPGFETYNDPVAGTAEITEGIMRQVRNAAPVLRRVAEEQFKTHRRAVIDILRCLDTGWMPQDLPSAGPGGSRAWRQQGLAASGKGSGPDRPILQVPPDGCQRASATPGGSGSRLDDRRLPRSVAAEAGYPKKRSLPTRRFSLIAQAGHLPRAERPTSGYVSVAGAVRSRSRWHHTRPFRGCQFREAF